MTKPIEEQSPAERQATLAEFGLAVLQILSAHHDWDSDVFDSLASNAEHLAEMDEDGYFKMKAILCAPAEPRTWLACPNCGCTDLKCDAMVESNNPDVVATVYDGDHFCSRCDEETGDPDTANAERTAESMEGGQS